MPPPKGPEWSYVAAIPDSDDYKCTLFGLIYQPTASRIRVDTYLEELESANIPT